MSEEVNTSIERHEQNAARAAADENLREFRKEEEDEIEQPIDDIDDEVVRPASKTENLKSNLASSSNDNVKKEAPEMSIQLQR